MYSTLKHEKSLERILVSNRTKQRIALGKWFSNGSQFYLIVRDPYAKIESFFREKFRKSLDYYDKKGFWQDSQKLFFPFLELDDRTPSAEIKEKLRQTSFSEMVSILPKVYLKDGHLTPQYLKTKLELHVFNLNLTSEIKTQKTFKLESQEDLNELMEIFDINVTSKVNSTSSVEEDLTWNADNLKIISTIYQRDFELFDYKEKGY